MISHQYDGVIDERVRWSQRTSRPYSIEQVCPYGERTRAGCIGAIVTGGHRTSTKPNSVTRSRAVLVPRHAVAGKGACSKGGGTSSNTCLESIGCGLAGTVIGTCSTNTLDVARAGVNVLQVARNIISSARRIVKCHFAIVEGSMIDWIVCLNSGWRPDLVGARAEC